MLASKKEHNMFIIKRDGRKEQVKLEKINKRILNISKDLKHVEAVEVAQKVIAGLYDGVTSRELDKLAVETAAGLATKHPEYDVLASRLSISSLHKDTPSSFWECVQKLHGNTDVHGSKKPLVSDVFFNTVKKHHKVIDSQINHKNDFKYDYFGYSTLERSYLLRVDKKIVERPQYMLMRCAIGIHGSDLEEAFRTYEQLSEHLFTHATPTLFNAGTPKPQLSSCFLLHTKDDSIDGIYSTLTDIAKISQCAGGIGVHVHNIRAKGSPIFGTGGKSNGLIPMLKVFESTTRYIDQCFSGDSKVICKDSTKNIEDVSTGDLVKTSDGNWNLVTKTKSFDYTGDMIKIMVGNEEVCVTDNHIFLAIRNEESYTIDILREKLRNGTIKPEWTSAKDLTYDDIILSYNSPS